MKNEWIFLISCVYLCNWMNGVPKSPLDPVPRLFHRVLDEVCRKWIGMDRGLLIHRLEQMKSKVVVKLNNKHTCDKKCHLPSWQHRLTASGLGPSFDVDFWVHSWMRRMRSGVPWRVPWWTRVDFDECIFDERDEDFSEWCQYKVSQVILISDVCKMLQFTNELWLLYKHLFLILSRQTGINECWSGLLSR